MSDGPTMRRRFGTYGFLAALNVAALALLAAVELSAPAAAQVGRPRGTYVAAEGRINGTETHALYIVDESTQETIAVQWDPRSKQLVGLGYRNLAADAVEIVRPRTN